MRAGITALAGLIAIALTVGLVRAQSDHASDQARIAELEAAIAEERRTVRVLRSEIAHLEDPIRLRRLAENELGLVPANPLRVVPMEDASLFYEPPAASNRPGSPGATLASDRNEP